MELYRDLSTFEFNFSRRNKREMFMRIKDMKIRLVNLHELCEPKGSKGEQVSGWLNEQQV